MSGYAELDSKVEIGTKSMSIPSSTVCTEQGELNRTLFEAIFERASDGYVVMDESLCVQYMNQTAITWFGGSQLGHVTCGELVHCKTEQGNSLQNNHCFGCFALSHHTSLAEEQMTITQQNGKQIAASVSYSYIPYEHGRYLLMAIRDISAQKKFEQERMMNEALRLTIEERERIARDLHDTVAQDMAYSSLQIKRMRKEVINSTSTLESTADSLKLADCLKIADSLKLISESIDHSIDELRSSLYDLNFVLETDFIQFVRDNAVRLEERLGISTSVHVQDTCGSWPDKIEEQLARIVKEVFTNIHKHAKAKNVIITIERNEKAMEVTIQDDGCGFAVSDKSKTEHFGFRSIMERCNLLGGKATVLTEKGQGTIWHFFVPEKSEMVS